MNAATNWTSAIAILAAGLILGVLVVIYFTRRKSPAIDTNPELKDLEAKRDALVQQLRDLDENATPEERQRLERETATVLRALDGHTASPATSQPRNPATSRPTMNPTVKGFLYGAGSFAALAALFFFVSQKMSPRQEGMEATGAIPGQQQQQQQPTADAQATDILIRQMEAVVAKQPDNNTARLQLARLYLERENAQGVFEQTSAVLERNPNDPRALTMNALIRVRREPEVAVQMLEKSTKIDPKDLDTWVTLAWVYSISGRMKDAEGAITEAIKVSPENKAQLEAVLAQMKGELPAGHPPVDGQQPATAAAADGKSVTVTIDLDPAASRRSGVLFVMARNPAGGPPYAVKRVMASSFPMTVQLGAADSMMGQQLPDQFRLEARLDSDGDPMTRPATDPAAAQNDVSVGQSVILALK